MRPYPDGRPTPPAPDEEGMAQRLVNLTYAAWALVGFTVGFAVGALVLSMLL